MSNFIEEPFDSNNVSSSQEIEHLMAGELDPDPRKEEFKYELRQWFAAFGAILGAISAGITGGFSAVLIPQLELNSTIKEFSFTNSTTNNFFGNMNEITIQTTTQKSWLGFSGALLLAPGCWMSGFMIEKLGRRMTHLVTSPLYFLAWITITVSPSFDILVAGRLFTSLFMGLLGPACPVYIAETTNPRLRGILLGCISVAASSGNLLAHAAGTWMHWRLASLWCGSLNIICFIVCFLSPESPTWLLKKGKIESATNAWSFLRGPGALKEFEALRCAHAPKTVKKIPGLMMDRGRKIKEENGKEGRDKEENYKERYHEDENDRDGTDKEELSWQRIMTSKPFLKPLGIVCLLFFTAQCSGVNSITYYSVDIVKQVADPERAFMWTLILDVVKVLVCGLTCWMIKRVSNRVLALVSGAGTALVLFSLALVQYYDVGSPWTPVVLLIAYNITSFIGLIPLSWMLCGELFPVAYKGLGTGLTSGFGFLCLFFVVLSAPYMFDFFLAYGTFFIYGCIATGGSSLLFLYLPETRGKTLLEIERSFQKSNGDFRKVKNGCETSVVV